MWRPVTSCVALTGPGSGVWRNGCKSPGVHRRTRRSPGNNPVSPPTEAAGGANRWAYSVACSLLEPSTDEDWSFLRKWALSEFDDAWVDAGAIQTLKLIASPRSRGILEEARRRNSSRVRSVSQAIEYIESKPAPLVGSNLETLAERAAQALSIGKWKGNGKPQCNETGDKALVDFTFESGRDSIIYTATFHKSKAIWVLRGVRETMQMLMPAPVPMARPQ